MDKNKYLTTGEVAHIMSTTKNTLFHYDQLGIFSPEIKAKNDYRYYAVSQLEVLDVILTLRELDVPLSEIKTYLSQRSPAHYEMLLNTEETIINRQIQKLQKKKKWIKEQRTQALACTQIIPNQIQTMHLSRMYLLRKDLDDYSDMNISKKLGELIHEYYQTEDMTGYTVWYIQKENDIAHSQYDHYREVSLAMTSPARGLHCDLLPAGDYISICYSGDWNTISSAYKKLHEYVQKHRITTDGNYYEENIIDAKMASDYKDYLTRVMVRVL